LVTNQEVKPGNWIWLFPVTYVCHVSEEYFGGFTKVAAASGGRAMGTKEFFLLTSIGFLFIAAGMILVRNKKSMRWILITLSTIFFVNALSHTTWTILARAYNPGIITSWLLWIPLALFTCLRFHPIMSPKNFWISVVVGSSINLIVSIVAFLG
jgi:Protein of unknown function with HXXEE motif